MVPFLNGWVRDPLDSRDVTYTAPAPLLDNPPDAADLTPLLPPVDFQGRLGSCGLNALDGLLRFDQRAQGLPDVPTARLFGYYNTRYLMRTLGQDSGVQNRTMLKAHAAWGFCPEELLKYDVSRYRERPSDACYAAARPNRLSAYAAVPQDERAMMATLAGGKPFIAGFSVYPAYQSDAVTHTGRVPLPRLGERPIGGHDVLICGYDRLRKVWIFRNSYGPDWGQGGNGELPWEFLTRPDLGADFWTVYKVPTPRVETPAPPAVGAPARVIVTDAAGHEIARYNLTTG